MTLWGHALRRIRHLHVRPSPLALCTRASGTPRLLSTCIPLSAEATAVNPLDKAMSQSQRYRDLTSPLQKLEQLVDHYYQERLTDGYIPVNNFVYRDRLWALYEQIPKDTVLTAEQYHALVSIAPVSRTSPEKAVERIESVLKKMVYQGYAIGERALVSLLFAYKGQPNARDKVETLLAQWPHSPTQTSGVYHVLLQVYAAQVGMTKAESWLNSKIGTLVYSEYDGRRVERPLIKNEPFYGTIMTGYAIEGKFDMAVLKLREFLSTNPRHRTRVVNKFLYALVRNGKHKEAISWFYEVRKYGIPSDRLTFDTILAAVFKLQIQQNAVPTLLDIQTQIGKEESVTAFSKRETDCRPGTGTAEGKNSQNASSNTPQQPTEQDQKDFSAMGSCLVDSMPESNTIALNVFNQMIASGYSPKISTLNIFLTTYMHAKLYTHVITLFEHMKQHMDIHADAGTYSIVLKSLSLLGRHNDVVSLAKEISQDFIEIDMVLYSTLMDVYGRAGKYDEALEFYDQIVTSGQKPSILCLQILMHVHCLRYVLLLYNYGSEIHTMQKRHGIRDSGLGANH